MKSYLICTWYTDTYECISPVSKDRLGSSVSLQSKPVDYPGRGQAERDADEEADGGQEVDVADLFLVVLGRQVGHRRVADPQRVVGNVEEENWDLEKRG